MKLTFLGSESKTGDSPTLYATDHGRPLLHDLVTDPEIVARHEAWILRALEAATPFAAYVAEDPTRARPPVRLGTAKGARPT